MPIHIKYFASLRERMGRHDDAIDSGNIETVADVWARVSGNKPMPVNTLVAVNMEYADMKRAVKEGDEVAFFPPVTGG
jgi:molybdopterin synthase sulfur carrier subunit